MNEMKRHRGVQIKTARRYYLTWVQVAIIEKSTGNAGEGVEKREASHTVVRNVNGYVHWRTVWRFLDKPRVEFIIRPSNPTAGHMPRENHKPKRHRHPNLHCSTTYNRQGVEAT